jgi:hypothetical protein
MKTNRREFSLLGAAAVAMAFSTSPPLSALAFDPSQTVGREAELPWYRRIRRVGQTVSFRFVRYAGAVPRDAFSLSG